MVDQVSDWVEEEEGGSSETNKMDLRILLLNNQPVSTHVVLTGSDWIKALGEWKQRFW